MYEGSIICVHGKYAFQSPSLTSRKTKHLAVEVSVLLFMIKDDMLTLMAKEGLL